MTRRTRLPAGLLAAALVGVALPAGHSSASPVPGGLANASIMFAGYKWMVRNSPTPAYPGPNSYLWTNAYKDLSGALHLKYTPSIFGKWSGAEVESVKEFGFGTYTWTIGVPLNNFDPNVSVGLFSRLPTADTLRNAREIDIEVAKFGRPTLPPAQFVVQPAGVSGHLRRANVPGTKTSVLQFRWLPGRVDFSAYDSAGKAVARWTFRGSGVPPAGSNRLSMNIWTYLGRNPSDNKTAEIIIKNFTFCAMGQTCA